MPPRLRPFLTLFALTMLFGPERAQAATPVGTILTNTASAVFTDISLIASTTTSNTLSVTVQNAPALTATAAGNQNVTIGMIVTDTFTLTNTGNGTGTFALTGDASFAGGAAGTVLN